MSDLLLYLGMDVPPLAWSAALTDVDVVLEPFHPLVKYGGFAERFPAARRFVYVNPTSVDPWVLERADHRPPLIGEDREWSLPRLDLDDPAGLDWAVQQAVDAFESGDSRPDGLFVDDLDRLLPDRSELCIEFLARVTNAIGQEPRWFLNRGFELWPRVEALDAVLLEDISPLVSQYGDVDQIRWLREVVLPAVDAVRRRGVRVHAVSYADQEGADQVAPDVSVHADLHGAVDSVHTGLDRRIWQWVIR